MAQVGGDQAFLHEVYESYRATVARGQNRWDFLKLLKDTQVRKEDVLMFETGTDGATVGRLMKAADAAAKRVGVTIDSFKRQNILNETGVVDGTDPARIANAARTLRSQGMASQLTDATKTDAVAEEALKAALKDFVTKGLIDESLVARLAAPAPENVNLPEPVPVVESTPEPTPTGMPAPVMTPMPAPVAESIIPPRPISVQRGHIPALPVHRAIPSGMPNASPEVVRQQSSKLFMISSLSFAKRTVLLQLHPDWSQYRAGLVADVMVSNEQGRPELAAESMRKLGLLDHYKHIVVQAHPDWTDVHAEAKAIISMGAITKDEQTLMSGRSLLSSLMSPERIFKQATKTQTTPA